MPRDVTVTPAELRRWIEHASYHIRLAVAIGSLASKLRERNILELQWAHFDPDPRKTTFNPRVIHFVKVRHHRTAKCTRRALVAPVSSQLLRILKDAWQRAPGALRRDLPRRAREGYYGRCPCGGRGLRPDLRA